MFTKSLLLGALLGATTLSMSGQTTVPPWGRPSGSLTTSEAVNPDRITINGLYVNGFSPPGPSQGVRDESGALLSGGGDSDGDGTVIQLGYFANPDIGGTADWTSFTALTGNPGGPAHRITTMGDFGVPAGFDGLFTVTLTLDVATDADVLPAGGYSYRLGMRFYNDTTVAGSTHYNTVTSDELLWLLPAPSPQGSPGAVQMDMDVHPLTWESGAGGAFQTAILLVPEPSSGLLALLGFLPLLARRRPRD